VRNYRCPEETFDVDDSIISLSRLAVKRFHKIPAPTAPRAGCGPPFLGFRCLRVFRGPSLFLSRAFDLWPLMQ